MNDRVTQVCPVCGDKGVSLYLILGASESAYGLSMVASCQSCEFERTSLVSWEVLHFVLRVSAKDFPNRKLPGIPHRWLPWKFRFISAFRRKAAIRQVDENSFSFFPLTWEEEGRMMVNPHDWFVSGSTGINGSHGKEIAEHRVIGPIIGAILNSSGDLITVSKYLQYSFGSVGQPLAS